MVEREQGGEEVGVGHVGLPAVGGKDGGVEFAVCVLKPSGFLLYSAVSVRVLSERSPSQLFRASSSFFAASAMAFSCAGVAFGNGKVSKLVVGVYCGRVSRRPQVASAQT